MKKSNFHKKVKKKKRYLDVIKRQALVHREAPRHPDTTETVHPGLSGFLKRKLIERFVGSLDELPQICKTDPSTGLQTCKINLELKGLF